MLKEESKMYVNPNPDLILRSGCDADEEFYNYDEKGRILKMWDSEGNEEKYEYDSEGAATCTTKDGIVYKFDKDANLIYVGEPGYEKWAEYNQFGKSIHYKEVIEKEEYEEWGEYNAAGFLIHIKNSMDEESWWTYDSENRLLEMKKNDGCQIRNEYWENGKIRMSCDHHRYGVKRISYNERGLPIHMWSSNGHESYWEYNEMGKETYRADFERNECWKEYDEYGNLIHIRQNGGRKNFGGYEEWREYDSSGNMVHKRDNTGFEEWQDFDMAGRLLLCRNNRGQSYHNEYDDTGKLVYREHSDGKEEWYCYDESGNQTHYQRVKDK